MKPYWTWCNTALLGVWNTGTLEYWNMFAIAVPYGPKTGHLLAQNCGLWLNCDTECTHPTADGNLEGVLPRELGARKGALTFDLMS
jgi:hypothetical protein